MNKPKITLVLEQSDLADGDENSRFITISGDILDSVKYGDEHIIKWADGNTISKYKAFDCGSPNPKFEKVTTYLPASAKIMDVISLIDNHRNGNSVCSEAELIDVIYHILNDQYEI